MTHVTTQQTWTDAQLFFSRLVPLSWHLLSVAILQPRLDITLCLSRILKTIPSGPLLLRHCRVDAALHIRIVFPNLPFLNAGSETPSSSTSGSTETKHCSLATRISTQILHAPPCAYTGCGAPQPARNVATRNLGSKLSIRGCHNYISMYFSHVTSLSLSLYIYVYTFYIDNT